VEKEYLSHLIQYCENPDCGETLEIPSGIITSKRRMTFTGFDGKGDAGYVCPECGDGRKFALNSPNEGFHEVKSEGIGCGRLLIILTLAMVLFSSCMGILAAMEAA
jgi:hypothetical protein